MAEETRGFQISNGVKTFDSIALEKRGIVCTDEPNIDARSFANEFLYNDDAQTYSLNQSVPNQQTFTLKFELAIFGPEATETMNQLIAFFDAIGQEFTIRRNATKFPNTFVVDSFSGDRRAKGSLIPFEVTASYVGDFRDYEVRRKRVIFNGDQELFEFDHYFKDPEPSTIFDEAIRGQFIQDLNTNTGKTQGVVYNFRPLEPFDEIKITNQTTNEIFRVNNYNFIVGDEIIFDTELDEPEFTLIRNQDRTNLLEYVDFTVSSLPILHPGNNEIRIDLYRDGVGIDNVLTYALFWERVI